MPFWPQPSQWAGRVVPVPLEALARCVKHVGEPCGMPDGSVQPLTVEMLIAQWTQDGPEVDAYILPQPSGMHSAGIRYGADGPEYLSPYCDAAKLDALLKAHGGKAAHASANASPALSLRPETASHTDRQDTPLKKSDSIMAAFWGANNARNSATLIRQMIRQGKDDAAILEAVKSDGALPQRPIAPENGTLDDWICGMQEAIATIRAERPDPHQELIDSAYYKQMQAERAGRKNIPLWDPIYTHQESVARLLGWFHRQILRNGFWGMVGNLNRDGAMMPALAHLAAAEMQRDPELLGLVQRIAQCAISAHLERHYDETEPAPADVRKRAADAEEAQSAYQRLGSATEGHVETRALDLYQSIVAEWGHDNDPYALEKLGPLEYQRRLAE